MIIYVKTKINLLTGLQDKLLTENRYVARVNIREVSFGG